MPAPDAPTFYPPEPESLEQTGLPESLVEQLILKLLYFRGDLFGQDLSVAVGLKFSVIQDIVESLKLRHHLQIKRSLGVGNVSALLTLTESGRSRARDALETNQYAGPAPVPLEQYIGAVRKQKPVDGWLTKEGLRRALRGMVLTEQVLSQIGPAVSSGNSMLVYGKPGDGKTFLIESLNGVESASIFVPHALECQGNIIQLFDPIYHQRIEDEERSVLTVAIERTYDHRWVRCKRPFIVSGGELSMPMLDLKFNDVSKVYEAPLQLKANNGMYLIDDFGRQLASPAEVLNRWIVPMERRVDYLSFLTGGKMTAPFETFLVFSTNLNPADLGDEAFLRRIQYKMLLQGPSDSEFVRIFEGFCASRKLPCPQGLALRFLEKHYRPINKPMRRCHPRDVLSHVLNLIHFEKLPYQITETLLDRAYESCFVQENQGAAPVETVIVPAEIKSCADHWGDRLAQIATAFGSLAFLSEYYDRDTGRYYELTSAREYGEAETGRALARLHGQAFRDWLGLNLEQQKRDLLLYTASTQGAAARLRGLPEDLAATFTPPSATADEQALFTHDLAMVLQALPGREEPSAPAADPELAEPIRRIA